MSLKERLGLFSFLLAEFGADDFDSLAWPLRDPALEQPGSGGTTRFHDALAAHRAPACRVASPELRLYDEAVQRHTEAISGRRPRTVQWRYFQYLALVFAERFLHRRFGDADGLLDDLNEHLAEFNERLPRDAAGVPDFGRDDLRKLAIWSATGSGKTLLMHVNLLQVRAHLEQTGQAGDFNRILLLTPNEGLSRQHREELRLSGIEAELFTKDVGSLFTGQQVEIIDIHKLRNEEGERSVAIDAFGDNNLVLVDEGHRGAGGDHWMSARDRLCRQGFSLEYSATFGQAFATPGELQDRYAKWVGFEYAYRRFHTDGYGKDFRILNFPADDNEPGRRLYLAAALLSFYQQLRYYSDQALPLAPFNIERPLWAFVGSSVTASSVRTERGQAVSDVLDIALSFATFLNEPDEMAKNIEALVSGGGGLVDTRGNSIFSEAFPYLQELGLDGEELYADVLQEFFNAPSGGPLRIVRRRGIEGELALQVGESSPFGLINVGDAAKLHKLCAEHGDALVVDEIDADHSLFDRVNQPESPIKLVIGAKKFIEGWNSWRVSSLGLMKVGRTEGAQIIQLFGRGVRLKGVDMCLKRSSAVDPPITDRPEHIGLLETLSVFGVKADYMTTFRDQLELEGVAARRLSATVPVLLPKTWPEGLNTIRLSADADFEHGARGIGLAPEGEVRTPAVLNWYARVESISSKETGAGGAVTLNEVSLTPGQTAFVDRDELVRNLARYKQERGWHHLVIDKAGVDALLARDDWYHLYVPPELTAVSGFRDVLRWQEIVLALMQSWCERRFKDHRVAWQQPHLGYFPFGPDDPNILESYEVSVRAEDCDLLVELHNLIAALEDEERGVLSVDKAGTIQLLNLREHIYRPLLYVDVNGDVIAKPTALNDGESRFVKDLHAWCRDGADGLLDGRQFHLLRNQVRGRGVGFFEAGNFYPDFMIWILEEGVQRLVFVDPKGIVRAAGKNDPKIQLHRTIKDVEARLGGKEMRLSSFIISNTAFSDIPWWSGTKSELEDEHVLFQYDDYKTYVRDLFERALKDTEKPATTKAG